MKEVKWAGDGNITRSGLVELPKSRNGRVSEQLARKLDKISDHPQQESSKEEVANVITRLCRHPLSGVPILLAVLLILYLLVVHLANEIADWMNRIIWMPVEEQVSNLVPAGFWNDFLIGDYGILSLGLANAFLTVLPVLSVFFLAFNLLEEINYLPNLSALSRRILKRVGLSGGAVMPLVLGFGCKTLATMSLKDLPSKKERYIAAYLIAFAIPCAAQMGLNMSILGRMGLNAFIIALVFLTSVEILAGVILNKLIKEDEKHPYIQELPQIKFPDLKAVLVKTFYRLGWFLKEAVPVFIYAALALFTIDRLGLLDALKNLLGPIIQGFLGLPLAMLDPLILCMVRQEVAAGLIIRLVEKGQLNYIQCIVAVTVTTMFLPCLANFFAIIRQFGVKHATVMILMINISSILLAGALNWGLILLMAI